MKTYVFEGPPAEGQRPVMVTDRVVTRDSFGNEKVKETHRSTPPRSYLGGWCHYQVRFGGQVRSFVARPEKLEATLLALGWHREPEKSRVCFFPRGTWEADTEQKPGVFPCPKPEILQEISGHPELSI